MFSSDDLTVTFRRASNRNSFQSLTISTAQMANTEPSASSVAGLGTQTEHSPSAGAADVVEVAAEAGTSQGDGISAPKQDSDEIPAAPQQEIRTQIDSDFVPPPVISGIEDASPRGPPPVVASITDPSVGDRLSSSLAELTNRVSLAVRDSSSSVSRVIKNVVPAAARTQSACPLILCFGDSITERGCSVTNEDWGVGWSALLADRFMTRADFLTRGFSGYNTRFALRVFSRAMSGPAEQASVVLIWFGANDAALENRSTQHVPVEEYGLNLAKIVFGIRELRKVYPMIPVLITPPPIQDDLAGQDVASTEINGSKRKNSVTANYAQACVEVARRMNTPCVDMFTAMSQHAGDQNGLKELLFDGLHLSAEGNRCASDIFFNELRVKLPFLSDEKLKCWFPRWDEIDPRDGGSLFKQ